MVVLTFAKACVEHVWAVYLHLLTHGFEPGWAASSMGDTACYGRQRV